MGEHGMLRPRGRCVVRPEACAEKSSKKCDKDNKSGGGKRVR